MHTNIYFEKKKGIIYGTHQSPGFWNLNYPYKDFYNNNTTNIQVYYATLRRMAQVKFGFKGFCISYV